MVFISFMAFEKHKNYSKKKKKGKKESHFCKLQFRECSYLFFGVIRFFSEKIIRMTTQLL